MLLAGFYNEHRGALLASLRAEYQIGFRDFPLRELAEYTAHLPPGCALWRAVGGPNAWSAEMHLLNHIEWRLHILDWRKTPSGQKVRNQPKLSDPPAYASEKVPENAHTERQAAAYQRRQARTQ